MGCKMAYRQKKVPKTEKDREEDREKLLDFVVGNIDSITGFTREASDGLGNVSLRTLWELSDTVETLDAKVRGVVSDHKYVGEVYEPDTVSDDAES